MLAAPTASELSPHLLVGERVLNGRLVLSCPHNIGALATGTKDMTELNNSINNTLIYFILTTRLNYYYFTARLDLLLC